MIELRNALPWRKQLRGLAAAVFLTQFLILPAGDCTTFTVTGTADSGPGSLRQAIVDANTNAGVDTVLFAIPGMGPHSIRPTSSLPAITDAVTIDGYSEPGAVEATLTSPAVLMIELAGTFAGWTSGLHISAGGCIVRGLAVNRFQCHGLIAGDGCAIQGNHIGTDITGSADRGNGSEGVICYYGNTIGGATPADRNVISGNDFCGLYLVGNSNVVLGNYIGTDATGSVPLGNACDGVWLEAVNNNTIGGTGGCGNVISGNGGWGIYVLDYSVDRGGIGTQDDAAGTWGATREGVRGVVDPRSPGARRVGRLRSYVPPPHATHGPTTRSGTRIIGNYIGTDATGTTSIGNGAGIILHYCFGTPTCNSVGGVGVGEPNVIAFNSLTGVDVLGSAATNAILCNTIHSNGSLGIDLGRDGVTPNDEGDGDGGPNGLQNFPILHTLVVCSDTTTIQGSLNSAPTDTFRLQFFHSATTDPSGHGEAEFFLGDTTVTTDTSGDVQFAVSFNYAVPDSHVLCATATDAEGNTSEFGPTVVVGTWDVVAVSVEDSTIALSWTALSGAAEYWVYGAANRAYFEPGLAPGYDYRLAVVSGDSTTWATPEGIGDPDDQWSYQLIAVHGSGEELARSNRVGEFDQALGD
jgi:hypothetical protein